MTDTKPPPVNELKTTPSNELNEQQASGNSANTPQATDDDAVPMLTDVDDIIMALRGRGRNARHLTTSLEDGKLHVVRGAYDMKEDTVDNEVVQQMMRDGLMRYDCGYRLTKLGRERQQQLKQQRWNAGRAW